MVDCGTNWGRSKVLRKNGTAMQNDSARCLDVFLHRWHYLGDGIPRPGGGRGPGSGRLNKKTGRTWRRSPGASKGQIMNISDKPDQKAAVMPPDDSDLAQQIFNTMISVPGVKPGHRPVHAKGILCRGTFASSGKAAALSKAAHFQGGSTPLTIRFSDGAPDPAVPENSYDASPRGIAVRFHLPGDGLTDIVALSHNGFAVATGQEFLALQKAIVTTDPSKPHPWPIEAFLGTHPAALKFVTEIRVIPASLANEAFFSNNAFVLVNARGSRQAVRYQVVPVAGRHDLTEAEAKTKSPNFLIEDLKTRLAAGPVQFRLVIQIPNPGDATADPSQVWPEDRQTMDAGMISITSAVADSAEVERGLVFDPTHLTDGIELSDDELPTLRARVYSLSATHRMKS
jgi:catalase